MLPPCSPAIDGFKSLFDCALNVSYSSTYTVRAQSYNPHPRGQSGECSYELILKLRIRCSSDRSLLLTVVPHPPDGGGIATDGKLGLGQVFGRERDRSSGPPQPEDYGCSAASGRTCTTRDSHSTIFGCTSLDEGPRAVTSRPPDIVALAHLIHSKWNGNTCAARGRNDQGSCSCAGWNRRDDR